MNAAVIGMLPCSRLFRKLGQRGHVDSPGPRGRCSITTQLAIVATKALALTIVLRTAAAFPREATGTGKRSGSPIYSANLGIPPDHENDQVRL